MNRLSDHRIAPDSSHAAGQHLAEAFQDFIALIAELTGIGAEREVGLQALPVHQTNGRMPPVLERITRIDRPTLSIPLQERPVVSSPRRWKPIYRRAINDALTLSATVCNPSNHLLTVRVHYRGGEDPVIYRLKGKPVQSNRTSALASASKPSGTKPYIEPDCVSISGDIDLVEVHAEAPITVSFALVRSIECEFASGG